MLAATGERLHGLVWAVVANAGGATRELPPGTPLAVPDEGWLWLHFNLADGRTRHSLQSLLGLPATVATLLCDIDEFQQLHAYAAFTCGMISDIARDIDGPTDQFGFLHFAIAPRLIVTCRRQALTAVDQTRRALGSDQIKADSTATLFGIIVDELAEAIDRFADRLGSEIDQIEDQVILGLTGDQRRTLGRLRRTTLRLHRHVTGLRLTVQQLERLAVRAAADHGLLEAVKPHHQRVEQLEREIVGLRERARLLQEEVSALLAEETNRHLRVLSILSIVFLPPTFIAGLLGMNLKGMLFAESELGFWAGTGLAVASAALVLWIISQMGVLGSREPD